MYGPSNDFSSTKFNQVFGPNPNHHKEFIKTTRNGVKLSLESNQILNSETKSDLAARGIGNFALRAVSFGTLGTKTFSEKDLTKFEKEAYRFTGQHALNEKKDENAQIYKTRLNLRQQLNKATKENNIKEVSKINNELTNTNYKKGFIKYETYAATDNEKITREMKLFTGRATSENIKVGDKEAVRITDVYDFERKGYNPILSLLAEVETQQQQGFNATRTAVAGLSWLSNLGDKYTGGASSYNVDIILSKDGTELDKTELEKYRQENAYGESDPTIQDRMIGLGRLAQDTSGLILAGSAAYAMKNNGFAKNATKLGKAGIIGGLILAPLLAGAVYESTVGDFDNSINVINYNQDSINSFFSSSFNNVGTPFNNATQNVDNTASSVTNFFTNFLKRASRVPVEANKLFRNQGLNEQQASLAAKATLLTGAALAIGGTAATIYAANKAVKNKELVNNLIANKSLKKAGLIGALGIGAAMLTSTFLASKAEAATIPKDKIKVIDADTFIVPGIHSKIRLHGADAPETSVYDKYHANTPQEKAEAKKKYLDRLNQGDKKDVSKTAFITQDFSLEAKTATQKFIDSSTNIKVISRGVDAYDRQLSSLENEKGQDLSDYLVSQGLAYTELPTSKFNDGSLKSYARYESMVKAYQEKRGIFSKDDFVNPTDFRKGEMKSFKKQLDISIKTEQFKAQGIGNNQYATILADGDSYFTLSASLGASAHYGASLESNLMRQAGYNNMSSVQPYKGLAETVMEYNNHMLNLPPLSSFEKFVAKAYDSGLSAGGVGNWLNRELFMPKGWGRVYKDEKGALPSIAGLAGKILDESYLYYANMNPDWTVLGQDYKSGRGYSAIEDQSGMFQTMFEDTTSFGLSVAQSLAMYVAITQPLEMISAGISKSFLDRSIQGTIVNNTPNSTNPLKTLNKARNFGDIFMAEYYFGDLASQATKPGGMLAAVLQQKIHTDTLEGNNAFFNHEEGRGSAFKTQLMIQRGRAKILLEGTFKPFLMDIVNPFDETAVGSHIIKDPLSPTGTRRVNSYDKFNLAINKLIDIIASPIDLKVGFKPNTSIEFTGVNVILSDISDDIKLAEAKAHKGGVTINKSSITHAINNYTNLSTQYNSYTKKINAHVVNNNEELYKLLTTQAGMSDDAAKRFIFTNGDKKEVLNSIDQSNRARVEVLLERKSQLNIAKEQMNAQLSSYADKVEITTSNTGIKYKTNIAAALQEILDMTPLNPLKWGLFNSSAEFRDEFVQVGQTFSFRDAADYTAQLLTGETSLSAIFKQYEPIIPDPFIDGQKLTIEQNLSNKVKSRIVSFDNIIGHMWKSIKSFWSPEPKIGPNISELTKDLRQVEISVVKAAEKAKVEGFRFSQVEDSLDAARRSTDIIAANVDESVDLLDSVIEYSHSVRKNGTRIISISDMGKAIGNAGIADVTGTIMQDINKFSKNIKIDDVLGGAKGYIAAAVFAGLALNNIMQSTKGASIITQLGLALYGEDEDIAIKYEANRLLPTEVLSVALGLDQTTVNLVADTVAIGSTYAIGYQIAKRIKTGGYSAYTFDAETVYKMLDNEHITITAPDGKGGLAEVDKDYLSKMGAGHDSFIYVNKSVATPSGETIIKQTVLTRTMNGFKSEKILQEFAKNVPTRAFIFGSLALLATNGIRQGAATMLAAMAESPDDKSYLALLGGLTLGGFVLGAINDKEYITKAVEQGTEIAKAGGQVASSRGLKNIFTTKAGRWALAGAIAGSAILVGKLVLDPNIKQKGSLDPLVAGVALGLGAGIFKRSAGLGLAAGFVAMSAMAALNWAGIRVLEIGRAGKELDPENLKLVAQLSQFSTAVLEKEKDNNAFIIGMAAYSSQFSAGKSILSKDSGSIANETQVIAKQSPLPVLQFFVAEKIEGRRGETFDRVTPDSESTIRTYTLGIQTGALLGTSISVELPVSYTPGEGFFGFTYNSENNLMTVPNFVIKVGVWAALTTASLGLMYNMGSWLSNQAYNLTGQQMFKTGGANFATAANDLFSASRVVLNASEKITSYFIRTAVGIFSTLQGTDARLAFETYKNSVSKTAQAQDMLSTMSVKDLSLASPEDAAKINTIDDISNAKEAWKQIREGQILQYTARSKHLAVGALLGAVAGGIVSDVVKHFRLKSSMEANVAYDTLQQIESQEERRKMIYIAIGGSIGAIGNDIRSGNALIRTLYKHHSTAVNEFAKGKNLPLEGIQQAIARTDAKFNISSRTAKYKSIVLNNKIAKFVAGNSKLLGRNKFVGVFIAATIYNFIKTGSEFGIASMIDKHIVYDNKGNAYKDHDQQTQTNHLHHIGVAATLGLYHTAIIGLAASPNLNQRATILEYAKRELASVEPIKTSGVINKIKTASNDILFSVNRYRADKESNALLKSLLSIDNEFAEYEKWLEGTKENPNLKLPKKLEKVQDVLKLRAALGKEELKQFIKLRNQKQAGVGFDFEEAETYKKFLTNLTNTLSQTDDVYVDGILKKVSKFKSLNKGFQVTSNLTSLSRRATAIVALSIAAKFVITTVGNQGGEVGKDSMLDRIYNKANQVGKIGQRRQDGSKVGLEGSIGFIADALRMITGRDVGDLNYAVGQLNGKMVKTTGQRLVSNAKNMMQIQKNVKDLSEMLIVDNPNAYIATLDFGGKTLRNGDKGTTTSSYFQLQGPAQDISTATYSMSAKFIFSQYTAGRGRLGKILDSGLASFRTNDKESWNAAAVNIRNATSMLDAMKAPSRTFSKEVSASLAGDSLASVILALRQERLAQISWQPVDSLFTTMFFETVDKAKQRTSQENFVNFLKGIARSDRNVLAMFGDLMSSGVFENFFTRSAITNVMFFTGGVGKPPKKGNAQSMATDISDLWHQTHDLSVQAEMFNQNKVEVLDQFMDKVIMPLSSHGIFAVIPQWMKIGGLAIATLAISAVMTMSIASYTDTKTRSQSISEMLEVFGREEAVVGPKVAIYPNDTNKITKELHKHLKDGQKYKWDFKANQGELQVVVGKAGTESRYVGLLNIGQDGKPLHVRFELNPYLDVLNDDNTAKFVNTVTTKGDHLRNLFLYVQNDLDESGKVIGQSKTSIAKQLLEIKNIETWFKTNSTGKSFESVYDIFKTSNTAISKTQFIGAAVDNFQSKFSQGLDNLFDLGDLNNIDHHLLATVMVDGQEVLVGELLNPEFKLPGITEGGPATNMAERRQALIAHHKNAKAQFLEEIREIVEEEYKKIGWSGKGSNVTDDAILIAEANRKALLAIKTKMADPSSKIGAITKGAGIIQTTTLEDQQSTINKSKGNNKKRHTITTSTGANGNPIDTFIDEMGDTLHYSRPIGNVGFWDSLAGGGKGLMTAGFAIFDVLTGADVLGAYLRVAEIQDNPFATDLDKTMANKELGRAILSSAVGLGIGMLGGKLLKGLGSETMKKLITPKNVAKGVVGLAGAGALIGMTWKSLIAPGIAKLNKATKDNNILGKGKEVFDNIWFKAGDIVGEVAAAPVVWSYNIGKHFGVGKESAFFTGGFLGGFGMASVVMAGLGLIGMGVSLPVLAATAAGIGLVIGVAAIFGGKKMTSGMTYATREVLKIPVLGSFTGMTDPYRAIRNQERFKHHFHDSPFLLGYVGDLVNSNWLQMLSASENPGGRDTVALLFGEVLAQGEGTTDNISAWKLNAADSMIGTPKPIIDEVVSNELRLRAEAYSDLVIGRYTWEQLVDNSDNSNTIRSMEAAKRADRMKILEQSKARAIKVAMDAGGPAQALKTNNPRKSALTQQQLAKVDQVYKDLDSYNKPTMQVTAASVTTHKSNTTNSNLEYGNQVKALTLGVNTAPITKNHVYKTNVVVHKKTASVNFKKEADPMNPILIKQADTMGANKQPSIEQQTQTQVYNLYKNGS